MRALFDLWTNSQRPQIFDIFQLETISYLILYIVSHIPINKILIKINIEMYIEDDNSHEYNILKTTNTYNSVGGGRQVLFFLY
jgi:hypothetical protein